MKTEELAVGKQIVHKSYPEDPGEYGFVTSWKSDGTVYCRFWSQHDSTGLRTIANSESCSIQNLQSYVVVPQEFVTATISKLRAEPYRFGWHEQGEDVR